MRIAQITNANPKSGVGYHACYLHKTMTKLAPGTQLDAYFLDGVKRELFMNGKTIAEVTKLHGLLNSKTINWLRLSQRLQPLLQSGSYDLCHATNQTLSYLVNTHQPWIVTVHDLIEYQAPQGLANALAAKFLYRGITRASHLIAVSNYTAEQIIKVFKIPSDRITVIPNGICRDFRPLQGFRTSAIFTTWQKKLSLPPDAPVVLYVGSDHPRKNAITAIRAFDKLRQKYPEAIFIKCGAAGMAAGRQKLKKTINQLNLQSHVRFVENISEEELVELYNLANVLIFPSLNEGFGLPPLQAMACGTPVLSSNTTSLPEIVGSAALFNEPYDVNGFTDDMLRVIEDTNTRENLIKAGLLQAAKYTWEDVANRTLEVYKKVT